MSLRITEVDIIFKTKGSIYCYCKRVEVIKSYKIKKTVRGVRKRLEEAVRWSIEGMTQMEIAARIGVSQPAINKWMKKPEWLEIENRLREQKAKIFMDEFTDKTKEEFERMLERSKRIAAAFEEDAITSLKIARAVKDEALAKLDQKRISAEKAGKMSEVSTPHQSAAVKSHKEARETWEHVYGLSEILRLLQDEILEEDEDGKKNSKRD